MLPVWRSLPLPVADRFFARRARRSRGRPRVLFVGRSTEHRERFLDAPKHAFDCSTSRSASAPTRARELMREHDVGINLHNEPYPVVREPRLACTSPPAISCSASRSTRRTASSRASTTVEVGSAGEPCTPLALLQRFPNVHHRVRVRGRAKAEGFRASRVYPRLVHDLLLDLRVFGTERG